ncbi:glycosyltransferase [bacterium]|nr:glycosyltransferase [bacterium]
MKPAILISGEANHLSIIKQLAQHKNCELIIFWNSLADVLEKENIGYIDFNEFLDKRAKFDAEVYANYAFPQWTEILNSIGFQRQFSFLGESFFFKIKETLKDSFKTDFINLVFLVEGFKNLIQKYDLRIVVVQNDQTLTTKTLIGTAQKFKIPTLLVSGSIPVNKNLHEKIHTDKATVSGKHTFDWYTKLGVPKDKLVITGNPAWDKYYNFPIDKKFACKRLKLDSYKPIVTVATNKIDTFSILTTEKDLFEHYKNILLAIAEVKKHIDFQVILKVHPSEISKNDENSQLYKYEELITELGMNVNDFLITYKDTEIVLAASDLLINISSNIGIEALLLGKTVISLGQEGLYKDGDSVIFAQSFEELKESILTSLIDENVAKSLDFVRSQTIERFNFLFDGRSTQRVTKLINEMAKLPQLQVSRVSIVIVTYNSAKTIRNCIKSILSYTKVDYEIIVVDNASTDETEKILKSQRNIKLISNTKNYGVPSGYNQGIKIAEGDFIVLLSPETIVSSNWLNQLLNHFGKDVGAVAPLVNFKGTDQSLEKWFELPEEEIPQEILAREIYKKNAGKKFETKFLTNICLVVKKITLDEIGLLDEDLFGKTLELDLSLRLRHEKLRLLVALDTYIFYEGEELAENFEIPQEEAKKLYKKLENFYGISQVFDSKEIWGVDWLKPKTVPKSSVLQNLSPFGKVPKLVSIVMVTSNNFENTKLSLKSLIEFTNYTYELIIVDNCSTDETLPNLSTLEEIVLIKNKRNIGFIKALNQGASKSSGEFVIFLPNDTVVTLNWLTKLVHHADFSKEVGIVVPKSNIDKKLQNYDSLEEMHTFAERLAFENEGSFTETDEVHEKCFLIKTVVAKELGGYFNEQINDFEKDDLFEKVLAKGYKIFVAEDTFVHHLEIQKTQVKKNFLKPKEELIKIENLTEEETILPAENLETEQTEEILSFVTVVNTETELANLLAIFPKIKASFSSTEIYFSSNFIENGIDNFSDFNEQIAGIGMFFIISDEFQEVCQSSNLVLKLNDSDWFSEIPALENKNKISLSVNDSEEEIKNKILQAKNT